MNKKILNSKGVSLISLSIAVMIMLIVTGTIIYNVKDNLKVEKLEQMQQDIENLKDKIDVYYAQYGAIPIKEAEYTNITDMQKAGIISQAVDTGKFYVIDLQAIENLTLTFGQDYENVKTLTDSAQISQYTNLYIINEDSHNIFYPAGIEIDGKVFYTNYTVEDVDTEEVVLININEIEDSWSPVYDKNGKYVDKNGDEAIIPAGFKVSRTEGMNTIMDGLVVKAPDESEFVWVPIKNVVTEKEIDGNINKAMAINLGTESLPKYRGILYEFSGTESVVIENCTITSTSYREPDNLSSTYDNSTNISNWTSEMYQNEYNTMIEKVKKYGGFYVGRYETSINEETVASLPKTPMHAGSNNQKWYGMYDKQKNYASKNNLSNVVGSSMIWGSQYDAMLNWILKGKDKDKVTQSSKSHSLISEEDKMNNIYNLQNYYREWTLEASVKAIRTLRGGFWDTNSPASYRNTGDTIVDIAYTTNGSRLTLYIQ